MPDLADRISRAAVAALDLAPFDDRFATLSRQVLTGGASRFGRVVDGRQAITYVLPVGVAGERIDYGALVLQPEAAGLLWRDADGIDHHASVSVTPSTPATYAEVSLGGEPWVRFSVGAASRLTFLLPPVKSRALVPMLVDYFGATAGPAPATVLPEPTPEPAAVRFPDPAPAPPVATSPWDAPAPPSTDAIAAERAEVEDATIVMPYDPTAPAPPAAIAPALPPHLRGPGAARPADATSSLDATQPMSLVEVAGPIPVLSPASPVEAEPAVSPPPQPGSGPQPSPWASATFDLFRDEPRPEVAPEPTRVLDPGAFPSGPVQPWQPSPPRPPAVPGPMPGPSARREPVAAASAFVPVSQVTSQTLRGFVVALLATLGVGAVVIVFQLLG